MVWPCPVMPCCECPIGTFVIQMVQLVQLVQSHWYSCHTLQMLSFPTAGKATQYAWFVLHSKAISIIAWSPYRAFPIWVPLRAPMSLGIQVDTAFPVVNSVRIWRSLLVILLLSLYCNVQEAIIYLLLGIECPRIPVITIVLPLWPIPKSLGFISHSLEHRGLNKASDMLATSNSH